MADLGTATYEWLVLSLQITQGDPGFNGAWVSSIEALGRNGDIWAGPISKDFVGGGAGFAWSGGGPQVTEGVGSLTGIRWTTTLASAGEGVPLALTSFSGVDIRADGLRQLPLSPVPAPATGWLLLSGLAGLGVMGRRRRH